MSKSEEALYQKIEELEQECSRNRTELHRMQLLLKEERKLREEAQQESKNKANFVAVLSHEIRNPLNGIIAISDLLQETELTEEQQNYMEIIQSSNESLLELVNSILDMSRLEAGKMTVAHNPFDLINTVEDLIYMLAPQAFSKNVEVILDVESEIPLFVVGDVLKVRQIFLNLMQNAIKFTHTGEVVFELKRVPSLEENEVAVSFSIRDTGIGMSEKQLQHIFDVYTQVHESAHHVYEGAGLGMTITKNLIELLGGRIEVSSEIGKGTVIEILMTFERYTDLPSIPFEDDVLEGMRFLVVDRQTTSRNTIVDMLQGWGAHAESSPEMDGNLVERVGMGDFDVVFIDGSTLRRGEVFRELHQIPDLNLFLLAWLGEKIEDGERDFFRSIVPKPIRKLHMLNAILAMEKNDRSSGRE
ncbi:sensor histidine kinase [Saccharibacillus qingshengii]|uniref:sensor histidine kinase n=1 Tax=Saccharibacillus qingshengii TaxID=1763540 RepID=UPI001557028C|nr:ATP-binding protein [Saccharibacillus qingshengii]